MGSDRGIPLLRDTNALKFVFLANSCERISVTFVPELVRGHSAARLVAAMPRCVLPADTVREAEQLKTREVQNPADIDSAAYVLAQWSRRVFGPRLVVLRVASNIWRQTVSRMASVSSVALIDVSEPTENLIWEIEELTRRSQTKCVFICRHDRALEIAAAAASVSPSSFDDDMGRLLEMEEILAYTTDRSGIKRFARALRGTLLSRAGVRSQRETTRR